jgi:hypothetical protein
MSFPEFAWASGEEASDPWVEHEGRKIRVDELARSGHVGRLESDLADVASLGIRVWRYGMPWRLTEPTPGRYDWALWNRALAACERQGLEPIVDLCHFGLPDHLPGFADERWVESFLRYVDAFLARYRTPRWFTPVNEPYTVALTAGRLGIWNDRRRSEEDFARILALCALANVEAHARIVADREGWSIGAEVANCPLPGAEDDPHAVRRLAFERASFDLPLGQPLDPRIEPVFEAVPDCIRARIDELATTERVIAGHVFYPVSLVAPAGARPPSLADRCDAYARYARAWYARYRTPFWIAETSNLGLPVARQVEWLDALAACVFALRGEGLPLRGLCWYSRGDQFDWQSLLTRPVGEVTEVGLFDHARRPRAVAARLRDLARAP